MFMSLPCFLLQTHNVADHWYMFALVCCCVKCTAWFWVQWHHGWWDRYSVWWGSSAILSSSYFIFVFISNYIWNYIYCCIYWKSVDYLFLLSHIWWNSAVGSNPVESNILGTASTPVILCIVIYLINLLWKLGLGFGLDSELHYFSIFTEK